MSVTVLDVYNAIDAFAPFELAEEWDNVGILAGRVNQQVHSILCALDLNAMAEKTLQLSERLLKGKKVEDRCYVDYAAVTLENIDEFMG